MSVRNAPLEWKIWPFGFNIAELFPTGLVVFHCTFLSMRSHDTSSHVGANIDHDLKGEKSSFAGFGPLVSQCTDKKIPSPNTDQGNPRQRIQACSPPVSR